MKKLTSTLRENSTHEWEHSFMLMPRKVLEILKYQDKTKRKQALLLIILISSCYYADGHKKIGNRIHACKKGEAIFTFRELALYTGMSDTHVKTLITTFEKQGILSMERTNGVNKIRLVRYEQFLQRIKPPKTEKNKPAAPGQRSFSELTPEEIAEAIALFNKPPHVSNKEK